MLLRKSVVIRRGLCKRALRKGQTMLLRKRTIIGHNGSRWLVGELDAVLLSKAVVIDSLIGHDAIEN
jgi:hypothetical protein